MHPTQSENLSHTSWIADSPAGVPSTISLLSDIPKLWRLVCRKKSPNCSSTHSRICECCYFKRWWRSHPRAKSSPSPSCTSVLNIFHFLQQLSLQQEHCWLQHNSGFWKRQVYSASHALVWMTHPGFVGIILNIILPSTDYNGATWSCTRYPSQPTACWEFSWYSGKFQGNVKASLGFQGGGESTNVGLACWGLR